MPGVGRAAIDYTDERITSQSFFADGTSIVFDQTQINGAAAAAIGKAVMYAASDDTVSLATDGSPVVGKLLKVESSFGSSAALCTVQIAGYTTLPRGSASGAPATPATVTRGTKQIGALGPSGTGTLPGYIRDTASATAAELVKTGPFAVTVPAVAGPLAVNDVVVDFGG